MLGPLKFVNQRNSVVFEGNPTIAEGNWAIALLVDNEAVPTQAELPCTLARFEEGGRAELSPVNFGSLQQLKRVGVRCGFRDPLFR
jgi:hypothetical protein